MALGEQQEELAAACVGACEAAMRSEPTGRNNRIGEASTTGTWRRMFEAVPLPGYCAASAPLDGPARELVLESARTVGVSYGMWARAGLHVSLFRAFGASLAEE